MSRILVVFGTRPEAIKLAPVVKALRQAGTFEVLDCADGEAWLAALARRAG